MNYFFIQSHGIKGVALATLIGCAVSLVSILLIMVRRKWMVVSKRFILSGVITAIVTASLFFFDNRLSGPTALAGVLLLIVQYFQEFRQLAQRALKGKLGSEGRANK